MVMEKSLMKDIGMRNLTIHTDKWSNNRTGYIEDNGDNIFRFSDGGDKPINRDSPKTFNQQYGIDGDYTPRITVNEPTTNEPSNPPIVACGYVGYLISRLRLNQDIQTIDIQTINETYLDCLLNEYKKVHKNDDDADLRDLDKEFYSRYKAEEEQCIKISENIFDFLTDSDVASIRGKIDRYLRYVDTQAAQYTGQSDTPPLSQKGQEQPPHFTRQFTPDEQKKLFDGLTNGGFLPKETIYSHFRYVFGGTAIPDNEKPFEPLQWIKTNSKTKGIYPSKISLLDLLCLLEVPDNEIKNRDLLNTFFVFTNSKKLTSQNYTYLTDKKGNLKKTIVSEYHNDLSNIVSKMAAK
jgi:hypothetical protein